MKTKLIPALLAAAALTSFAQSAVAPKVSNSSSSSSSSSSATSSRARSTAPAGQTAYGAAASSSARYGTRLNAIVRRGGPATGAGSIILTSPLPPEKFDELAEDLNVLTLIINRNLDRVFGEKSTEYRLGVPITMAAYRSIETSYIQDLGVLVKIHVPFPVATAGEREKKPEPAAAPDTEWEKARRALYGGERDPAGMPGMAGDGPATTAPAYDQKIVDDLKKEILDALQNIANIRHMSADESVTVAVIGSAEVTPAGIDPLTGLPTKPETSRPTILTLRVRKGASGEDLAKSAKVAAYFDTPTTASAGGYGGGGLIYGGDYGYVTRPGVR